MVCLVLRSDPQKREGRKTGRVTTRQAGRHARTKAQASMHAAYGGAACLHVGQLLLLSSQGARQAGWKVCLQGMT